MNKTTKFISIIVNIYISVFLFFVIIPILQSVLGNILTENKYRGLLISAIKILFIPTIIVIIYKIYIITVNKFEKCIGFYKSAREIDDDFFGIKEYHEYYFKRRNDCVGRVTEKIVSKHVNILIQGRPNIGKKRTCFEICKNLKNYVIIRINPEISKIENIFYSLIFSKKQNFILFLDEIEKYDKAPLDKLIKYLSKHGGHVNVIATSCDEEFKKYQQGVEFDSEMLNGITKEEGKEIADETGKIFSDDVFDGTPGSIILDLSFLNILKEKYKQLGDAKTIIISIKLLIESGISVFKEEQVKKICREIFQLSTRAHEWIDMKKQLQDAFILKVNGGNFDIPVAYVNYFLKNHIFAEKQYESLLGVILADNIVRDITRMGYRLLRKKQYNNARKCFNYAKDLLPGYASAYNGLGCICIDEGKVMSKSSESQRNYVEALNYFKISIKFEPGVLNHRNCAYAYTLLNDYKKSKEEYEKSLKLYYYSAVTHYLLGCLLANDKNKINGDKLKARDEFKLATEFDPNYVKAFYRLGNINAELGKAEYDNAITAFTSALSTKSSNNDSFISLYSDIHVSLGEIYRKKNDDKKAIEQYEQAVGLDPNNDKAFYYWGKLLTELGSIPEAIDKYTDAVQINPNNYRAWNNYGYLLSRIPGRMNEVKEKYDKAIAINPKYALAYNNLGYLLTALVKYENAVLNFRKAIENSSDSDSVYAQAYRGLGLVLYRYLGKYTDAEKAYREACKVDMKNEALTAEWVKIAERVKTPNEVVRIYIELFGAQPNNEPLTRAYLKFAEIYEVKIDTDIFKNYKLTPNQWAYLGEYLRKINDFKLSMIYVNTAIELEPTNPIANENKGLLIERLGDLAQEQDKKRFYLEAEKCFRIAIEAYEWHASARRFYALLLYKKLDREEDANTEFSKIAKENPNYAENNRDYGMFLVETKRNHKTGMEKVQSALNIFRRRRNKAKEVHMLEDFIKKHSQNP